jgi:hypothetical protein
MVCRCCGDPAGRKDVCGKTHPCLVSDPLCANRAKASLSKRPRSCGCFGRSRSAASSCNGKHACLREQDGIGPCHTEPSPQWDGFDSQDADVVGQAAGMDPWDDFDSQDGDVTQAGTHASPVSLRTGPVVPRPWRYPAAPLAPSLPCAPSGTPVLGARLFLLSLLSP